MSITEEDRGAAVTEALLIFGETREKLNRSVTVNPNIGKIDPRNQDDIMKAVMLSPFKELVDNGFPVDKAKQIVIDSFSKRLCYSCGATYNGTSDELTYFIEVFHLPSHDLKKPLSMTSSRKELMTISYNTRRDITCIHASESYRGEVSDNIINFIEEGFRQSPTVCYNKHNTALWHIGVNG